MPGNGHNRFAIDTALLALALIAIGLVPTGPALAEPSPVVELKPDTQSLSLTGDLAWLDDPDDQQGFPTVLSEAIQSEGLEPLSGQINCGYTVAARLNGIASNRPGSCLHSQSFPDSRARSHGRPPGRALRLPNRWCLSIGDFRVPGRP